MSEHFEDYNLYVFLTYLIEHLYPKDLLKEQEVMDYLIISLREFIEQKACTLSKNLTAVYRDYLNHK